MWEGLSGGCRAGLTLLRVTPTGCLRDSAGRLRRGGGFGHARGRENCRGKPSRAPQLAQAYRGTLDRVSKHQFRRGRRAARSSASQGGVEPLYARIKGVNRGVSEGKAVSPTKVCFVPTRANKERRTGKILGVFFRDAQDFGRLEAGPRAGFNVSKPPPQWTLVLKFSLFLHDVWL